MCRARGGRLELVDGGGQGVPGRAWAEEVVYVNIDTRVGPGCSELGCRFRLLVRLRVLVRCDRLQEVYWRRLQACVVDEIDISATVSRYYNNYFYSI